MNILNKIILKRAKQLARGSIRLQRGLFVTPDVWKQRREKHDSNVRFVDNFFKKYQQNRHS